MTAVYVGVFALGCLALGRRLYLLRWPDGLWPAEEDETLERIRRVGRKRVLPLPSGQAQGRGRRGGAP